MGKGSGRRPTQVEREKFESNWDKIFKKEKPKEKLKDKDKKLRNGVRKLL